MNTKSPNDHSHGVHVDVQAPVITSCPQHKTLDNKEGVSFAEYKLELPTYVDNSKNEVQMAVSY